MTYSASPHVMLDCKQVTAVLLSPLVLLLQFLKSAADCYRANGNMATRVCACVSYQQNNWITGTGPTGLPNILSPIFSVHIRDKKNCVCLRPHGRRGNVIVFNLSLI